MKTAKEILQDKKTWDKIFAKYPFEKYEEEMILTAMEEYAQVVAKNLHKPPVMPSYIKNCGCCGKLVEKDRWTIETKDGIISKFNSVSPLCKKCADDSDYPEW